MKNRILAFVAIVSILLANSACNDTSEKKRIEGLTKSRQKIVDSMMAGINKKNHPHYYADSLVNADHSLQTLGKIDSLLKVYPDDHLIYLSKGDWYYKNGRYYNALKEYDNSAIVAQNESPKFLDKKAQALIKLNNLNDAINCYKKAAELNFDYNYQLAVAYELGKKNDSAIKYYLLYSKSYPEEDRVKKHIDSLYNIKKRE